MRNAILALTVAALGSLTIRPACADDWNKTYSVPAAPELRVHIADGRVDVHTGSSSEIAAHVSTRGWKISPSEVQIIEHQMGNMVDLEVRVPHEHAHFGGNRDIRMDLSVPVNLTSNIETGDGAVVVHGVHGDTRIHTGDGAIRAEDVAGKLDLHTGDGSVTVRGRLDGLTIETGDGSVQAEIEQGSRVEMGWKIHTGDGSVTVRLPSDLQASLDAHTGDGSVSVDVPITMDNVSKDHNSVRGKLNGGGGPFRIESGDGSIHVGS